MHWTGGFSGFAEIKLRGLLGQGWSSKAFAILLPGLGVRFEHFLSFEACAFGRAEGCLLPFGRFLAHSFIIDSSDGFCMILEAKRCT